MMTRSGHCGTSSSLARVCASADSNGDTPLAYQPFLVDPVGRYLGIDLRKMF